MKRKNKKENTNKKKIFEGLKEVITGKISNRKRLGCTLSSFGDAATSCPCNKNFLSFSRFRSVQRNDVFVWHFNFSTYPKFSSLTSRLQV